MLQLYTGLVGCFIIFFPLSLLQMMVSFLRGSQIRNASHQKPNPLIYPSDSKCLWVLCFHNSLNENTVRIRR